MTQKSPSLHACRVRQPFGYIYLMGMGQGLVKIGRALDVAQRYREFATANPLLTILYTKPVANARRIERALHQQYRGQRFKGEWYLLTGQDVAAIMAHLDQQPAALEPGLAGALNRLHSQRRPR